MAKKIFLIALGLFFIEILIYLYAAQLTDILDMRYQLAARYSARLSFLIFSGMVFWIGVEGVKEIFRYESSRKLLVLWFISLFINHLIHFYFLVTNHYLKGWDLLVLNSAGGSVAYILMLACPIYLMIKPDWNHVTRKILLTSLAIIDAIFLLAYIKRLFKGTEMASPTYHYVIALVIIGIGLILNIYRWMENRRLSS